MAELLISKITITRPYGVKFRIGNPLVVQPDAAYWGPRELDTDRYEIIRMPLVSFERAQQMCVPYYIPAQPGDREYEALDQEDRIVRVAHRDCRFVREALPRNKRNELDRTGTLVEDADVRDAWRRLSYNRSRDEFTETDREFVSPRVSRIHGGRGGSQ